MSAENTSKRTDAVASLLPEFVPRGVAGPGHDLGYFSGLDDRVQAVDLETGQLAWSADEPGEPILASDGRLVVLQKSPNRNLSLLVLDEATGEEIGRCDTPLSLNADVTSVGEQFVIQPSIVDDRLHIDWEMQSKYKGGSPPPSDIRESMRQHESGAFDCELESGSFTTSLSAPERVPRHVACWPYRQNGAWQKTSWINGQELVYLEIRPTEDGKELALVSVDPSDDGKKISTVIETTNAVEPTLTPDGKYLFVRRTVPADKNWTIWRVSDHSKIGQLKYRPGIEYPTILDNIIFYIALDPDSAEHRMHAVRLSDGEEIWNLALEASAAEKAEPPPPPPLLR